MFAVLVGRSGPGESIRRQAFEFAEVRIGRIDENDLVLDQLEVSRRHARIVTTDDKYILVDLKSTHGSWVNGRRLTSPLVVRETDKIAIGDFSLQIVPSEERPAPPDLTAHYVAADAVEARLIRAITQREEGSRLVYADWLEERGDTLRAEFLRVQDALATMSPQGEVFRDRSTQLRHMARSIDVLWRVRVARPAIERCGGVAFDFRCPREWGALEATERNDVRFCNGCQKTVHYATSVEVARGHAEAGMCVALDLTSVRWQRDLDGPYGDAVCPRCTLDIGPSLRRCPRCGTSVVREVLMGSMA